MVISIKSNQTDQKKPYQIEQPGLYVHNVDSSKLRKTNHSNLVNTEQ
jgi:hypothetical protein